MTEKKIDVMTEDPPSEVTVDQAQRLIDLALKKGKSRSWTLDEICDLGGYPSSTLRGEDYILCGITHFTQEAAKKLEEKIAALPDLSAPTFEDQKALAARALELSFSAEEYSEFMKEFWPDQSHALTWEQYDRAKDALESRLPAADKEFYEEELEGLDAEEQLDKLFEREDERQKQEKEIEAKQKAALDELGFGDPKEPAAPGAISAAPSSETIQTTPAINSGAPNAASESGKNAGSDSISQEEATEPSSLESKTEESKGTKPGRRSKKASSSDSAAPGKPSVKRSAEGEVEYGFTEDPADYVFNAFRIQKIDLALIEINTKLEEARNPVRISVNRGPTPTFGLNFDQATQEQIDEAVSFIPESLKTDLKRACKHVLTAVSAITRKQSEIKDLEANFQALKRELEADLGAIQACYGSEIHEWAIRKLEADRKPDGSLRKKSIKTLAGVLTFRKSGGRKIDRKELVASILEKPEGERALFPIEEEVVYHVNVEEMESSGLLDAWEDLGLRGVTDIPVDEIGTFAIEPKPRGGE